MTADVTRVARIAVGAAVLAVIAWRVGTGPFLDGLRLVDLPVLLCGAVVGAVTTVCCAWRWQVVARGLGVDVGLRRAVADCYRAVFLNSTLPGGVLGDVHRGARHGRATGDRSGAARSVAWERLSGQVVQLGLTVVLLVLLPSFARPWVPWLLVGAVVLSAAGWLAWRRASGGAIPVVRRAAAVIGGDIRAALVSWRAWPVVVVASAVVVAGHATAFVVAARTAGVIGSVADVVPVALLVLAAMAVPLSVAGWGLREGAAAWAFAAAGLGAATGVTVAVVYGVMALAASLPGLAVLLADTWRSGPREVARG